MIYGVATNKRPRQGDRKQAIKDECLEYLSVHHPEFYPDSDQELPGRPVNARASRECAAPRGLKPTDWRLEFERRRRRAHQYQRAKCRSVAG